MTESQMDRIVSAAEMIERLRSIELDCLAHGELLLAADYADDCERISAEAFQVARS